MADIAGAVALNNLQFQQQLQISVLKSQQDAVQQVVEFVAESGANLASSGSQPLNVEGLGQIVNEIA